MADYFSLFPAIEFNTDNLKNIMARVVPVSLLLSEQTFFQYYLVKDNEKIEDVAFKFYGNARYHFVIFLINEIADPIGDWPLSQNELTQFVQNKYGSANEFSTHHYVAPTTSALSGEYVNSNFPGAIPVTNLDYENDLNEAKRKIKVLQPQFLAQFLSDFSKVMRSSSAGQ